MERIRTTYYTALIKYERHLDTLRDKLIEALVKFPVWGAVQGIFWRAGGMFLPSVHFFTAVYDVFSHFFPRAGAAAAQLIVYYIVLNPLLEFAAIVLADAFQNRREK